MFATGNFGKAKYSKTKCRTKKSLMEKQSVYNCKSDCFLDSKIAPEELRIKSTNHIQAKEEEE